MNTPAVVAKPQPVIRSIGPTVVFSAIAKGFSDFFRAPLYGLFFGGVYTLGGIAMLLFLYRLNMPWLILPIAIGFPLIGPFIAVGLYEVSRRLSEGESLNWKGILGVIFRQRERELSWMAFVVLFVFWIWLYQIRLLTAIFLGFRSMSSIEAFLNIATSTTEGISFLVVGTIFGGVLATVLYASTVIAIPLLLEREYDFVTAVITSFKTVIQNPLPMLVFAAIVTVAAIAAMVPFFLGLLVVLPVLGHATWHLYKAVIAPEQAENPR
ncbi:MAG: DUF2189 domain-containing protein [Nitratireductor sp.]